MAKGRKLFAAVMGLALSVSLCLQACISVQAEDYNNDSPGQLCGGIAAVLNPKNANSTDVVYATARKLNLELQIEKKEELESKLVMANVTNALNVRSEAGITAKRVGMLYADCGGTILERKDGWTKLQSGNVIGWCSDEFLLFGDDAQAVANSVGKMVATIKTESLRVREKPEKDAETCGVLPQGEIVEVMEQGTEGWVCVDYEGRNGYVQADYVTLDFVIGAGETVEEIAAREKKAEEAKRYVNYGEFTVDTDTMLLLAALIHCEARGESYEGQVAVGAVVMNRVRSQAYPNTIKGVIYAPGQFTPAMSGKVDQVLQSGKINSSCIDAAKEALSGKSNVGDRAHFRRNDGRAGLVIGNHVFY